MTTFLEVLIVEGDEPITAALAAALGKRGHRVATARDVEKALDLPTPDVFVCEARLSGGSGFDLLSAIAERGEPTRSVLLLSSPTVEDCLRALRLGAGTLLAKPFRIGDLVRAVEMESGRGYPGIEERSSFDRTYPAALESMESCARDLTTFCVRNGVPASIRARAAGAACEIVDNAGRHAQLAPNDGIRVRGQIRDGWLRLAIRDEGAGFDPRSAPDSMLPGPALTGLARARALADDFRIDTSSGTGTRVEMRFCVSTACLSDGMTDLSEAEFLHPRVARDVLHALLEGEAPEVTGISPAIAVVLGRLLAGPEPAAQPRGRTPGKARLP